MKNLRLIQIVFLAGILLFGCQEPTEDLGIDRALSFEEVVKVGAFEPVEEKNETVSSDSTFEERGDSTVWRCKVETKSIVQAAEDFPLFNPNATVIWPGNLLQGKTLSMATPEDINLARAGGKISIDIIDGNMEPDFTVEEVSRSQIAKAMNNIIANSTGVVPANFHLEVEEVHSQEHLSVAMDLNFESQFATVGAQMSFRSDKEYNRFLVKLNQSFYTMIFDSPTSADGFFDPDVTADDLARFISADNPATYISSVTYGRIYYMLIESSSSEMEINAAINATFQSGTVGGSVSAETDYLKSLQEMQIKMIALGGESKSTFATFGETNLANLADLFAESTDIRTGVPVSYTVNSVATGERVAVKLATEYDVKTCEPLSQELPNPILWYDMGDLAKTPGAGSNGEVDLGCEDCLESDGFFNFVALQDVYFKHQRVENKNYGTVVRRLRDLNNLESGYDAFSINGDKDSRPYFVPEGFNNKKPAIEFLYSRWDPVKPRQSKMQFSGAPFVGTDYTIFTVISYPEEVKYRLLQDVPFILQPESKPNSYGYFIRGGNGESFQRLTVGFQGNSMLRFSQGAEQSLVEKFTVPKGPFVLAVRLGKDYGMSVFINGKMVASNPALTRHLEGLENAMLTAHPTSEFNHSVRIRIGEIKAFGVEASDAMVMKISKKLRKKFGI